MRSITVIEDINSVPEMDVGPFFYPTQPNLSTYGPNPTHPSHTYVKCRHQHCTTHILHIRWWNKHPVSGCDWLSSCSENYHPLYTKFEPSISPAFFCKTTTACTLSVHCVRIARVFLQIFLAHNIITNTKCSEKNNSASHSTHPNPTQPNPTHPNPTQPNPWMDPTHVHLCNGHPL